MDMEGFNSFESADLGICAAKKIIRDALSRRAALSATNSEAVSELVEAARVLAEGEFELAPDAAAFEAAMDRLAEAVAKLGSRAPAA
jgi:hypothetical protein